MNSVPQTEATTFAFSSAFILLPWAAGDLCNTGQSDPPRRLSCPSRQQVDHQQVGGIQGSVQVNKSSLL